MIFHFLKTPFVQKLNSVVNLESEIVYCIVVGYAFNDLSRRIVIGIKSLFYPFADKVAENSAEIFVTGIGHKATRVSKHTEEATESREITR